MRYTFDSVMHISFTFSVDAESFDEALEKCAELKRTRTYSEFPELSMGDVDLHLCYADEVDGDYLNRSGMIDEWV